jgi:hypothetical protein
MKTIWLVTRGIVKLDCVGMKGNNVLLKGLRGKLNFDYQTLLVKTTFSNLT